MTNKQIVAGCLKGNRKAQDTLYEEYASKCYGICLRFSRRSEDAQDIFQDGMVKVYAALKTLQNADLLWPWMKSIIIRTALNYYPRNILKHYDISDGEIQIEDSTQDQLESMEVEGLIELISQLPDSLRNVFNLYVIDGYKHREIAEMMNISVNTSKSHLRDARLYLQKELLKIGVTKHLSYG